MAPGGAGQRQRARETGGEEVGPNPTDRGKPGTKRHLVVDARGTPLGVTLSGANRHDSMALAATLMLAPTLDAMPGVRARHRGRPRRRPDKLHADKGYDHRRCRHECRARGIKPRIARRGVESSLKLGRHRWFVERTHAWLNQFRRLAVRYDRRADLHLVLTTLTCAVICLRQVRRFVPDFKQTPRAKAPSASTKAGEPHLVAFPQVGNMLPSTMLKRWVALRRQLQLDLASWELTRFADGNQSVVLQTMCCRQASSYPAQPKLCRSYRV